MGRSHSPSGSSHVAVSPRDLRARRAFTLSSIVALHPSPPCRKPPSQSSKRCAPVSIRNARDAHSVLFQSAQFMDKKLFVHLQGGRKVSGTLRGYDLFLNLVIDDALEETNPAQKHPIGTVVSLRATLTSSICSLRRYRSSFTQVIRGNSVTSMETLEAIR